MSPQRRPAPRMPMVVLRHLPGLAGRPARPRRTVRLRLTLWYGGLFLACGAVLLAGTYALVVQAFVGNSAGNAICRAPGSGCYTIGAGQARALALQEHAAVLHELLSRSAMALAVMVVLSIALGWVVAGRVLRPLRAMTAATRRISEDNLAERLAVPGPGDELKDLGDTIDGLLERLEGAFTAQRRFVANASHELRTPLAMMRTSLDVAAAKPGPVPAQVMVLAGKLREGLDQADRLLESLLLLARAQHGAAGDQETVSLDRVLAAAIEARGEAIAAKDLRVRQATGGAWIGGDATLLSRMVDNVIDNAIRHNERGGWIRAETGAGATARLVVESGGPVLDQDSVTGLAQPFRRLGADRTGSANGTGLGLSIVAAIASAHGGTLRLHARPQGGLRVLIELPRAMHAGPAALPARPAALPAEAGARR